MNVQKMKDSLENIAPSMQNTTKTNLLSSEISWIFRLLLNGNMPSKTHVSEDSWNYFGELSLPPFWSNSKLMFVRALMHHICFGSFTDDKQSANDKKESVEQAAFIHARRRLLSMSRSGAAKKLLRLMMKNFNLESKLEIFKSKHRECCERFCTARLNKNFVLVSIEWDNEEDEEDNILQSLSDMVSTPSKGNFLSLSESSLSSNCSWIKKEEIRRKSIHKEVHKIEDVSLNSPLDSKDSTAAAMQALRDEIFCLRQEKADMKERMNQIIHNNNKVQN